MGTLAKDAKIPENAPKTLLLDSHVKYIKSFQENKDYTYIMTEYLRMSGLYWSLTAMSMMNALNEMDRAEILVFVDACFDPATGGFGASENHDPHLLYTLSAIQILLLYDELHRLDRDKVASFISNLEQPDGSFFGDKWGEVDSRFSFCAIASLKLIDRLDSIDLDAAVNFILRCMNFDGGFGCTPGSETHAGQVYCCVSALSIADALHHVDADTLGWWLCERQLPMSGGLNGRPEKLPDVCYSWWVLASLAVLDRLHWIDKEKLCSFILASQDDETGGMADRPGDLPDPFHTLFGLAGLSLLDYSDDVISKIDPVFCLPKHVLDKHGIRTQTLS